MRTLRKTLISLLLFASPCLAQRQTFFAQNTTVSGGTSQQATLARSFNGSSDFLQSDANLTTLSTSPILTIHFWLYQNSFGNTDAIALEQSTNFNGSTGSFYVNPNSSASGKFDFAVFTGSSTYLTCSFTRPSAAAWHQYTLVLNITATNGACSAAVDGVSQSVTKNTGSTALGGFANNHPIYVMSRGGASLWNAGRITSIALWTADESANASSLASCSTNVSTVDNTNLAYYWKIQQVSPETPTVGTPNLTVTGTTNVAGPCP